MACAMLNATKETVAIEDIEDAIQRCYLDAATYEEPLDVLERNFAELVAQLNVYKLINHLPSYEPVEEKAEEKAVEKAVVEEVKEVVAKSGIKEADKETFLKVLNSNLMGDELADEMANAGLPQLPEFMFVLLEFIIANNDVTSFIKTKNDISQFIPFRLSNYGSLLYAFYDNCDLEVHVEVLNQVVKFWNDKELPTVGL